MKATEFIKNIKNNEINCLISVSDKTVKIEDLIRYSIIKDNIVIDIIQYKSLSALERDLKKCKDYESLCSKIGKALGIDYSCAYKKIEDDTIIFATDIFVLENGFSNTMLEKWEREAMVKTITRYSKTESSKKFEESMIEDSPISEEMYQEMESIVTEIMVEELINYALNYKEEA